MHRHHISGNGRKIRGKDASTWRLVEMVFSMTGTYLLFLWPFLILTKEFSGSYSGKTLPFLSDSFCFCFFPSYCDIWVSLSDFFPWTFWMLKAIYPLWCVVLIWICPPYLHTIIVLIKNKSKSGGTQTCGFK